MRCCFLVLGFIFTLVLHAQREDFKHIDFSKADSIATKYRGESLKMYPVLTLKLTAPLETDVEKFRAIYYWVIDNIKGDATLMEENMAMRKELRNRPEALQQWNMKFKRKVFFKLLNDKETLCSGYSFLIEKMAALAGVECVIINGFGIDESIKPNADVANHSWNAVRLNGKWYLCDATWAAGYTSEDRGEYVFDYDDSYFLMDPQEFNESHVPLDLNWRFTGVIKN